MRTITLKRKLFTLAVSFILTSCQSTFGPSVISNTHPAYNQAIIDTANQQMLLNLVRLKYRDEMYFLKVSSVTSALSLTNTIGIGSSVSLPNASGVIQPSLGISYSDHPTVSYQPLQGEDFLKSVLSPIALESVLVLIQSGWNIERVFNLCVERANDLYNSSNSIVIANNESDFKKFKRMLKILRTLQLNHSIEIGLDKRSQNVMILFKPNANNQSNINELKSLLGLKNQAKEYNLFKVGTDFLTPDTTKINIQTRGLSSVMFYLAQSVISPQAHIDAGLVSIDAEKTAISQAFSEDFKVNVSENYPENAFIAIPYRGYWFYIADNDLKTKATFMLLSQLFDLQAGQTKYTGPTLTLPVR